MNEMAQASKSAKIWGWITLIMGVLAVLTPMVSGMAIVYVVAILLIIAGITRLIYGFKGGGVWEVLFGILSGIAGVVMLSRPVLGLAVFTIMIIAYFMVHGIGEIIEAFLIRPMQGWGFILFSGIVSVALAIILWSQMPLSALWLIGVLVGIQLIFAGITMITVGSAIKQAAEA